MKLKKVLNEPKTETDISLDKCYEQFSSLFSNGNIEEKINENLTSVRCKY